MKDNLRYALILQIVIIILIVVASLIWNFIFNYSSFLNLFEAIFYLSAGLWLGYFATREEK